MAGIEVTSVLPVSGHGEEKPKALTPGKVEMVAERNSFADPIPAVSNEIIVKARLE